MSNYIKHGTGPNDWKKGNRTRGKDRKNKSGNPHPGNQDKLQEQAAAAAETKEHYKQIAAQQEKRIKFGQGYALTLWENLNDYIKEKQDARQPITKAGLARASGMSYDQYLRYRKGELDHLLYQYMDLHDISYDHEGELLELDDGKKVFLVRMSEIIKSGELALQEQLESNCYLNKGNPLGSIAGMRNYFDWQENPTGQTTHNNTLVLNNVATLDEARKSLELLSE